MQGAPRSARPTQLCRGPPSPSPWHRQPARSRSATSPSRSPADPPIMMRFCVLVVVAAAVLAAAATTAHAARVPLTSKTLFASKSTADALPQTLVQDSFTATNATSLASLSATTGQSWSVVAGTLSIDNNRLRCSTCASAYGAALVDGDLPIVTATVNLRLAASGTAGSAGIVVN